MHTCAVIQAEAAVDRTLDESLEQQQRNEALTDAQQQQQQQPQQAQQQQQQQHHGADTTSGAALQMPKHYSPEHSAAAAAAAAAADPAAAVGRGDAPHLSVQSSGKQQQQQQQQQQELKCPITERVENWSAPADADIGKRYQWENALKASLNKVAQHYCFLLLATALVCATLLCRLICSSVDELL
jgi:hypothetical protein